MVRAKILLSLVTTMLLTSRPSMGMRLEPGGEYTGVTLVISDDVPDHDCEEMLAKIKVRLLETFFNGKSRLSESKLKIPYWYFEYYENEIWTIYSPCVCSPNHIKCHRSHATGQRY